MNPSNSGTDQKGTIKKKIGDVEYLMIDRKRGIFQEISSSRLFLFDQHKDYSDDELQQLIQRFLGENSQNSHRQFEACYQKNESTSSNLQAIYNKIRQCKAWQNILVPDLLYEYKNSLVVRMPAPDDICDYQTIPHVAYNTALPIRTKILILDSLTGLIMTLRDSFPSALKRLGANCVHVNPKTGDVRVLLNRCIDSAADEQEFAEDEMFLEVHSPDGLSEQMIVRFLIYTAFVLIVRRNPFDCRAAMMQYPLLTKQAIRDINTGRFGFHASASGQNGAAEADSADKVWRSLPTFFRNVIQSELSSSGQVHHLTLKEWQMKIRMLRDSLIIVKNKNVLYDWDVDQSLMLLKCNGYLIPVYPRKAIYWYHLGLSYTNGENGVIAGIDADYNLKNNSTILWTTKKGSQINKGKAIKLRPGLVINISGQEIQVLAAGYRDVPSADDNDNASGILSVNTALIDEGILNILDHRDEN